MPVSDVICQIVSGGLDAAVVARDDQVSPSLITGRSSRVMSLSLRFAMWTRC